MTPSSWLMASSSSDSINGIAAELSGTFTILREALILPSRNWRLILHVFLISLMVSFILNLSCFLSIYPLLMDLKSTNSSSIQSAQFGDNILMDIRLLAADLLAFAVVGFLCSSGTRAITICAVAAAAHREQLLTLRDLLWKLRATLGGSLITQVLVVFFYFLYALSLVFMFVLLLPPLLSKGVAVKAFVAIFLFLSASVCFFYLTAAWALSVVASVVEEGCYGVGAIKRGMTLFRGSELRGILILLLAAGLAVAISSGSNLFSDRISSGALWIESAALFIRIVVLEVLNLFVLAAIAVYYYACTERSQGIRMTTTSPAAAPTAGGDVGYFSLPGSDDA